MLTSAALPNNHLPGAPSRSAATGGRAFTLIEIVIVLVLTMILGAVLLARYTDVLTSARGSGALIQAQNVDRGFRAAASAYGNCSTARTGTPCGNGNPSSGPDSPAWIATNLATVQTETPATIVLATSATPGGDFASTGHVSVQYKSSTACLTVGQFVGQTGAVLEPVLTYIATCSTWP